MPIVVSGSVRKDWTTVESTPLLTSPTLLTGPTVLTGG